MRIAVIVLYLIAAFAPARADSAPKTPSDWADLAAAKAESIQDDKERTSDWLQIAHIYVDANKPKEAAKFLAKVQAVADTQTDAKSQSNLLLGIARLQAQMKERAACRQTLQQAEAAVSRLTRTEFGYDDPWVEIAILYLRIGDDKAAANTAAKTPDKRDWVMHLNSNAQRLVFQGELATALKAVKLIEDNAEGSEKYWRGQLEPIKIRILARQGDFSKARKAANDLTDPLERTRMLVDIATAARKAGKEKLWDELMAQAVELIDKMEADRSSRWVRRELLNAVAQAGLWEKAGEMVNKLPQGEERTQGWIDVANWRLVAGDVQAAKATRQKAQEEYDAPWPSTSPAEDPTGHAAMGGWITGQLAGLYAATGDFDRAVKIYDESGDKRFARSQISAATAWSGQGSALMKWAATMDPSGAIDVYLSAGRALIYKAKREAEAKANAQTRPATAANAPAISE